MHFTSFQYLLEGLAGRTCGTLAGGGIKLVGADGMGVCVSLRMSTFLMFVFASVANKAQSERERIPHHEAAAVASIPAAAAGQLPTGPPASESTSGSLEGRRGLQVAVSPGTDALVDSLREELRSAHSELAAATELRASTDSMIGALTCENQDFCIFHSTHISINALFIAFVLSHMFHSTCDPTPHPCRNAPATSRDSKYHDSFHTSPKL